jgi:hypothetical protein
LGALWRENDFLGAYCGALEVSRKLVFLLVFDNDIVGFGSNSEQSFLKHEKEALGASMADVEIFHAAFTTSICSLDLDLTSFLCVGTARSSGLRSFEY